MKQLVRGDAGTLSPFCQPFLLPALAGVPLCPLGSQLSGTAPAQACPTPTSSRKPSGTDTLKEVPKILQSLELHTATPFPPWAVGLSLGVWPLCGPRPLKGTGADNPLTTDDLHWGWKSDRLRGNTRTGRSPAQGLTGRKGFAPKGLASTPEHNL